VATTSRHLACFADNRHKGPCIAARDNVTKKLVPLFNPRRHKWHRHFRWDGPFLVGLTPIGRATVTVLQINLDHRVAFHQGLIDESVFRRPRGHARNGSKRQSPSRGSRRKADIVLLMTLYSGRLRPPVSAPPLPPPSW
jgi:hypothetical protein